MSEVCERRMAESFAFCVYLHKRPDGSVFYIGKGLPSRAHDFAPSRRTAWHRNVVSKYGRENIGVNVIPCASEHEALLLERIHIKVARLAGEQLVNLTDGGEGASGRKPTQKQLDGLAAGRANGKRGSKRARPEFDAWRISPRGVEHTKALAAAGAARLHAVRLVTCCQCSAVFETRSAKAKSCSRLCEQRGRRAKERAGA